jgi:CspA family cold shock protein
MTNFGTIESYDSSKGRGTIAPESGGTTLHFVKADLRQEAAQPEVGQRFGYNARQVGGSDPQAVNLQQDKQQSQAAKQKG